MSKYAVGVGWLKKTHRCVIFRHRAGSELFLSKHDNEIKNKQKRKRPLYDELN